MNTQRIMRALCVGALVLSGCGDEVIPPTQITARIYIAPEVRSQLANLHVRSATASGDTFTPTADRTFAAKALRPGNPIDVAFVPSAGSSHSKQIEIVVEARGANDVPLVQERAIANFVPKQQRVLELWLFPCGAQPIGTLCEADPACQGASCRTCVKDACGPTPVHTSLPELDPRATPDPNKTPPPDRGVSTSMDPVTGVGSCAGDDATVTCDDGNACNGKERCDARASTADARGCVLVEPARDCGQGKTCDVTSGECTTCESKSDGDGDGSTSTACGGEDCDDNDNANRPGGLEVCDGKDNDCSGTADDGTADAACAMNLPAGVTASCEAGACVQRCEAADQVLEGGFCVSRTSCPTPNPCAPGSCMAAGGGFSCVCGPGTERAANGLSCREHTWRPPFLVETLDGNAAGPRVAMNGAGAAIVAWSQSELLRDDVWSRRFAANAWAMPALVETINTDTAHAPDVGIDAAGTSVVAFQFGRGVRIARAPAGAPFGAAQVVEPPGPILLGAPLFGPFLSVPPAGIQHGLYYFDGGGLISHRSAPDGTSPAQQLISRETFTFNPQVAANAAGQAAAVWLQNGATADADRTIVMASRFNQGAWSTAQRIDVSSMKPAANPDIRARVGIDDMGNVLAVWAGPNGISWTRMNGMTGTWTPALAITNSTPASTVSLAVRPNGEALAVWLANSGDRTTLRASRFTPPAAWSPPVSIDGQSEGRSTVAEIASTPNGMSVIVWAQAGAILATTYLPGSGFRPAVRVSDQNVGASLPDVAIDDAGHATAVWQQTEGARTNIAASRLE